MENVNTRVSPEQEVLLPRSQALETGEAHARPQGRDLIVHEARVHAVEVLQKGNSDHGQEGEGRVQQGLTSVCIKISVPGKTRGQPTA